MCCVVWSSTVWCSVVHYSVDVCATVLMAVLSCPILSHSMFDLRGSDDSDRYWTCVIEDTTGLGCGLECRSGQVPSPLSLSIVL
jgi:hypothetical protein